MNLAFFQSQMDFVYFLYGLSFILVACVCLALNRQAKQLLPWHWLGSFGVLHGLHEWMELLPISLGDHLWMIKTNTGLMVASFICLIEFGRSGMRTLRGRSPGAWIYVPLGLLAAGGLAKGGVMDVTCRYVFCLTGGLGSAWTLWRASRGLAAGRRPLALAGWAMVLYALTAGIVVSKAPFFPASCINQEAFLRICGVPIQLVRGLIASGISVAVWFFAQDLLDAKGREEGMPAPLPRRDFWLFSIFIAVLVAGWGMTEILSRLEREDFAQALTVWAQAAAHEIDTGLLRRLSGSPMDEKLPEYQQLQRQLAGAGKTSWHVNGIALLRPRKAGVIFLLDTHLPNIESSALTAARPGDPYHADPAALSAVAAGRDGVIGPQAAEGGTYYGSYVAIRDPATKRILAVLVIETGLGTWQKYIVRNRLGGIGITLFVSLLILVISTIHFRNLEAAQRIAVSERHYRSLFSNMLGGGVYCKILPQTDERSFDLLCLEVNEMFETHTGLKKSAVVGRKFSELFPGFSAASEWLGPLPRSALEGEAVRFERYFGPLGRWFSVSAFSPLPGYCAVVLEDISQRKQAEKNMKRANDAALESARFKSEFMANMSHEIRTPMNAVLGMAALLMEGDLSPKQRKFAEVIEQSGKSLLNIINDILDFSKIESGQFTIETADMSLQKAVDDIVQMLAHSAQAKGVALSGSVSADLPALVRGDAVRISQVLTNLVGNAVKFSERGEVKIRAELQSQTASTILIRLTVQDNGVGISEEGQERLFQPFSQADASTARKFGGTGLGLAISKRIVELMGGTIGVDSKLGEGSTFWFTVPLERAALAGQASALQPLPAHEVRASEELQAFRAAVVSDGSKNRRILLAEDNPTNQMLTYYQLERLGYSVDIVSDGRQALEALARAPYDLVFMDCQMPELDGYQAAAEIRKSEGTTKHTPIVAMTAHVLEGEAAKCRDAGMDGYVAKPVTMDALKNVLRHWAGYTIETGDQPAASPTDLSVPVNMSIPLEATEGNPEALRRLVSTYISQTTSHLKDLERAIQANLPEDVKRIAHALAGSSDCFGAVLLVPTLREMERLGKERQLAKAPALWVKAMEDFEQVKRFLTVSANLESASAGGPADRDDHPS